MRTDLIDDWNEFDYKVEETMENMLEDMENVFDAATDIMKECEKLAPDAIKLLLRNMDLRLDCIRDIIDVEMDPLSHQIE